MKNCHKAIDCYPKLAISRDESAAIKGLLMCFVLLGHNFFFGLVFPKGTFEWLYSFHVSSFFILPFFYPSHPLSWQHVWTNIKRLFWPYSYMFLSLFVANSLLQKSFKIDFGLFDTWITGNFYRLSDYIGFQYLWFLPAMFSMLVIKDIFTSANFRVRRILLVVGAIMFVLFWVFLYKTPYEKAFNKTLTCFSLFSFMIGFAVFFLGWCTRKIMERVTLSSTFLLILLLMVLVAMVTTGSKPAFKYIWWLSRAACPFIGFCWLFLNRKEYNCLVLRKIGEFSLPIYLFHQPLNFATCTLIRQVQLPSVVQLVVSYVVVLFFSFLIAWCVNRSKLLRKLLFLK